MKILILGASGFIGKSLKEYFESKHEILAPIHSELDVMNGDDVEKYLKKHKVNVVLNAVGSSLADNSLEYLEARLRMFFNLARCSNLYDKQIYFGSGAEYAREWPIIDINEEKFDRKMPADQYGFFMHTCCKVAQRSDNIVNFRLFGCFGNYEDYRRRFISNAVCKVMLGLPITIRQNCIFDYLHSDDLCEFVNFGVKNHLNFHDYNITSGKKYSLLEIAELILKITNKSVPIYVGKQGLGKEYSGSNHRILGETKISVRPIEDGIDKMVKYYEKNIELIDKYSLMYSQ